MRFITRCPSCGTWFRVVADQLKIADGWVRCGRCHHVFDASVQLRPESEGALASATLASSVLASGSHRPNPPIEPAEQPSTPAPPTDSSTLPGVGSEQDDPAAAQTPEAVSSTPAPACDGGSAAIEQDPSAVTAAGEAAPNALHGLPRGAAAAQESEPTFVRSARRRARWRHPAVRALLALLALGLSALLAAQVAWLAREPLLARWPAWQPLLAAACARLGCELGPRPAAHRVVVEGSALLRRAPDRYSFQLVLRNPTSTDIAAPALELTLLDEQQQPMVRRVWLPAEWPQPLAVLAAGQEWPLLLELAFDHPQAGRMSGYQVVLFDP
ncbi:DUF3426 domain-containing protein [Tepidimonas alkaliphilus]|nr:DUF3426 domain-containing protein [Tepidimonas alkaliphilus]